MDSAVACQNWGLGIRFRPMTRSVRSWETKWPCRFCLRCTQTPSRTNNRTAVQALDIARFSPRGQLWLQNVLQGKSDTSRSFEHIQHGLSCHSSNKCPSPNPATNKPARYSVPSNPRHPRKDSTTSATTASSAASAPRGPSWTTSAYPRMKSP